MMNQGPSHGAVSAWDLSQILRIARRVICKEVLLLGGDVIFIALLVVLHQSLSIIDLMSRCC